MERIITKSFARLMGRGIHRGFITHEELNKSLGKRNLSGENLAQAFLHILDEKISLVEKKSDFKALKKRDSTNKDEPKTIDNERVGYKIAKANQECFEEKFENVIRFEKLKGFSRMTS